MPHINKRPQAEIDLIDIWLYIAEDSPQNADQYLRRIDKVFNILAEQPLMGKNRNDIESDIRSFPVDDHIIIYFPLDNGIDIVRVLGAAQDIKALFLI